ncbi:hypothetical protein CSUB8523_1827 [Campylobacter subantarcticus LMG 24377]|uniref:Uncharacterized protein n=2 Tax=Campylobacter subantarcticus TaxID=497724 RepID=A0A0A8HC47_9BACT|nr:hypothetical protein [Campylobacter subantarcticus]EAJ1261509.1 hypothetical protein [Campylobacter lari]AJC91527.1 hypothetical protein CSUB8521_1726 [Campylobacter subantarcticus LMG 24374]AJC93299.1 hypothetical protein CSUB8523_1827 [Campylobacter subantarcticus LMG 24377]EAL3939553.1 hypothetical protein [Campylobacter lari]MPB98509.1 hypothetical protein [Campylobacter subantarcticus]
MLSIFANFLSKFREFFVPSHLSLEFRAKTFAAIIVAKKNIKQESWQILADIASEIYPDDKSRQAILVQTSKEYVEKILKNELNLDSLLKNIAMLLKKNPRYVKKVNFHRLERLIDKNEEESLIQLRVYEFFEQEIKYIIEQIKKG